MALCRRIFQLGSTSAIRFPKHHLQGSSFSLANSFLLQSREISQLAKPDRKRGCYVDTLALVRKLEAQGVPTNQAEAITDEITEVLDHTLANIAHSFASKSEMRTFTKTQSNEHHLSLLQGDIDKLRSELRYVIDKVTTAQRLDLNLGKRRICGELANQEAEATHLTKKLDKEIHGLRTQLEATINFMQIYCIGTLVSISAIGIVYIRAFL